jgi:hypothetical protein
VIQYVIGYCFLSLIVLFGLFLVIWGWCLRNQNISMESKVAGNGLPAGREEEGEWTDLEMSAEDITLELSNDHRFQHLPVASSSDRGSLRFLKNLVAWVLAIPNRIKGSEPGATERDAHIQSTSSGPIEDLSRPADDNACIAHH